MWIDQNHCGTKLSFDHISFHLSRTHLQHHAWMRFSRKKKAWINFIQAEEKQERDKTNGKLTG